MHEKELKTKLMNLSTLLSSIQDPKTMYAVLRDLMTADEMLAIEQRRDIAQRIHT